MFFWSSLAFWWSNGCWQFDLSLVPLPFLNPAWTSGSSQFTYCWSLAWRILRIPCGSAGKESAHNAGDLDSVPGLGRSPGEREGYPLQYSGLENSMDCIVYEVAKSRTQLSDFHFHSGDYRNKAAYVECLLGGRSSWNRMDMGDYRCISQSLSHLPNQVILLFKY